MTTIYPFDHHPCWASSRVNLWERVHLPVAHRCNVKCIYCDHNGKTSCHIARPGRARKIMSVKEAFQRALHEITKRPNLRIVAISGPGDPLASSESLELLKQIREINDEIEFCLSTNGTLLKENVDRLHRIRVKTVTVTVNTRQPATAKKIYEWLKLEGKILKGNSMAEEIIRKQKEGIQLAIERGIRIKVNTVLMPNLNLHEVGDLAEYLAKIGVQLHNIIPLIPMPSIGVRSPSRAELLQARNLATIYIQQFFHCNQCRSDVVGIPGNDEIL